MSKDDLTFSAEAFLRLGIAVHDGAIKLMYNGMSQEKAIEKSFNAMEQIMEKLDKRLAEEELDIV